MDANIKVVPPRHRSNFRPQIGNAKRLLRNVNHPGYSRCPECKGKNDRHANICRDCGAPMGDA